MIRIADYIHRAQGQDERQTNAKKTNLLLINLRGPAIIVHFYQKINFLFNLRGLAIIVNSVFEKQYKCLPMLRRFVY